jgi:hypothetical protein
MSFAGLERASHRLAEIRAEQRRAEIIETLGENLPEGIGIERLDGGIRLSGRGLKRRLALDPEARASIRRAQ